MKIKSHRFVDEAQQHVSVAVDPVGCPSKPRSDISVGTAAAKLGAARGRAAARLTRRKGPAGAERSESHL